MKKIGQKKKTGRGAFVCVVRGAGIDVDIRVEDSKSLRAASKTISEGIGQAIAKIAGPAIAGSAGSAEAQFRPWGSDILEAISRVLTGHPGPSDEDLDRIASLVDDERTRRAETRS